MLTAPLVRALLIVGWSAAPLVADIAAAGAAPSPVSRRPDSLAVRTLKGRAPAANGAAGIRVYPWPAPGSLDDAERKTTALAALFDSDSLGQEWSRWILLRRGDCEPFRGGSFVIGMTEYWALRCETDLEGGRLASYAYLLGADDEPTVERVTWEIGRGAEPGADALAALAGRLATRLATRFGEPRYPTNASLMDPGSAGWQDVVEFTTRGGSLRLYRLASSGSTQLDSLVVEHRSARLLAAADEAVPTGELSDTLDVSIPRAELARRTTVALASKWADLSTLVRPDHSRIADLSAARRALVLAARTGTSPADRDLLRFGVHLWLAGCDDLPGWSEGDSAAVRPILAALGEFGVRIERSHDGDWCYDGAIADSLAMDPGRSPWATLAFLELMDRGWESHCALCGWDQPFGPDEFVPVIAHSEAYLAAHPGGPIAELVELRVAEAHETAWSLSKAAPDDDYIDSRKYVLQAPRHRERALALYERFLAGKPATVKPALRERLCRMRLDIDTNFHKYWCLWD